MAADKTEAARLVHDDTASGPVIVHPSDVKVCDHPGGRGDRLVIAIRVYNKHKFVDVRRWYLDKKTGAYMPTKGCSIGGDPDVLRSLALGITRAAETLETERAKTTPAGGPDA